MHFANFEQGTKTMMMRYGDQGSERFAIYVIIPNVKIWRSMALNINGSSGNSWWWDFFVRFVHEYWKKNRTMFSVIGFSNYPVDPHSQRKSSACAQGLLNPPLSHPGGWGERRDLFNGLWDLLMNLAFKIPKTCLPSLGAAIEQLLGLDCWSDCQGKSSTCFEGLRVHQRDFSYFQCSLYNIPFFLIFVKRIVFHASEPSGGLNVHVPTVVMNMMATKWGQWSIKHGGGLITDTGRNYCLRFPFVRRSQSTRRSKVSGKQVHRF